MTYDPDKIVLMTINYRCKPDHLSCMISYLL